jgi:hypothetical protein
MPAMQAPNDGPAPCGCCGWMPAGFSSDATRARKAQHLIGWRLHHLNRAPGKLTGDFVFSFFQATLSVRIG